VVLGAALLVAAGRVQAQPATEDAASRKAHIEHALADQHIVGVTVTVAKDVATLAGQVPSVWAKQKAELLALEEPGVGEVVNHLEVQRAESDADLAEAVAARLRRDVLYSIFDDIGVQVNDGVVTLKGSVTMGYKLKDAAEVAARVPGVREVRDELELLPTSGFDDQLRWAIANRIYRDTMFEEYAFRADPPIHIVVDRGRVKLTGWVRSEVERVKAGFLAGEVLGVFSVDNQLRVG
jgi:hyperosmotically inducible protein